MMNETLFSSLNFENFEEEILSFFSKCRKNELQFSTILKKPEQFAISYLNCHLEMKDMFRGWRQNSAFFLYTTSMKKWLNQFSVVQIQSVRVKFPGSFFRQNTFFPCEWRRQGLIWRYHWVGNDLLEKNIDQTLLLGAFAP